MNTTLFAACTGASICLSGLPQPGADGSFVQTVISIVIGIVAAISVLFVAIGGMRYILSQGDPSAVSKAKGTIVYALIGLAVAIVAQGIVSFVLKVIT
ncbi:hypothetical protein BH09PAT3_BH09PAT3_3240 [soil metagenome]